MCCYQGDCAPVPNTTRSVARCGSDCTLEAACGAALDGGRELLAAMQGKDAASGGGGGGGVRMACLALASIEHAMCSGADEAHCPRMTSTKAKCVDRGAAFQKLSCCAWLAAVGALVGYGAANRLHRLWTGQPAAA
jgi:hypothetical protein